MGNRDRLAEAPREAERLPFDLPLYRDVDRHLGLGVRHTTGYDQVRHLCDHWRAAFVIVDATNPDLWPARFASIQNPKPVGANHLHDWIANPLLDRLLKLC